MNLCKYKDIFGKPIQGVHSYRIANVAVVDVVLTIIAAWLIHRFLLPQFHLLWVTVGLFLVGIAAHRLFCVRTTVDKLLFP